MLKKNRFRLLFILFSLIAILFAVHAYQNQTGWLFDQIIAISLFSLAIIFRKKLRLTPFMYYLLALAITLHNAGTFGFYNVSPIFIQYDHITHFFGLFALTLFFYNLYSKNTEFSWFEVALISFLITMGIGALIEIWEFVAHLTRNEFLAGLVLDKTDQGREWVNSMIDLVYNAAGCLFAIIIKQLKRIINKI